MSYSLSRRARRREGREGEEGMKRGREREGEGGKREGRGRVEGGKREGEVSNTCQYTVINHIRAYSKVLTNCGFLKSRVSHSLIKL